MPKYPGFYWNYNPGCLSPGNIKNLTITMILTYVLIGEDSNIYDIGLCPLSPVLLQSCKTIRSLSSCIKSLPKYKLRENCCRWIMKISSFLCFISWVFEELPGKNETSKYHLGPDPRNQSASKLIDTDNNQIQPWFHCVCLYFLEVSCTKRYI